MNPVEQYISQFEPEVQSRLNSLRTLFFEVLSNTEESIRYQIPSFKVGDGYLYFAAYKNHIGFYPVYNSHEFENELSAYRAKKAKNSLHFKHNDPLPLDLIEKIINYSRGHK